MKHNLKIYIDRYRYSNPYVRAVFVLRVFIYIDPTRVRLHRNLSYG